VATELNGNSTQSEVQTIAVLNADGGTFKLQYQGVTTGAIAAGASAATVETALRGLSTIGPSGNTNVAVTRNAVTGGLNTS